MRKVTKQVMAVGIAIALAATSVPMTTQTVSAAKKTAAKKAGKKSSKKSSKKSKNTISLKVGSKKKLKVKGVSKKTKIKWKSSKKKVAAVSKKGVVKAKKAGTTKITAKYGKKKKVLIGSDQGNAGGNGHDDGIKRGKQIITDDLPRGFCHRLGRNIHLAGRCFLRNLLMAKPFGEIR